MPTSTDGLFTAVVEPDWAYVMLRADVAGPTVRVWRRFNGETSLVRSGDTARVVAGVAVACDTEAPVGAPVTYWADGTGEVEVVVPDLAGQEADTWAKPVARPGDAVAVRISAWAQFDHEPREHVSYVVGRPDPVIESDVRSLPTSTLTLTAWTSAELAGVMRAFSTGVVLMQPPRGMREQVYASVGPIKQDQLGVASEGLWQVTLGLRHVARPATAGAKLLVPGMAYTDNPDLSAGTYLDNLLGV